jgi:hypothetical protein
VRSRTFSGPPVDVLVDYPRRVACDKRSRRDISSYNATCANDGTDADCNLTWLTFADLVMVGPGDLGFHSPCRPKLRTNPECGEG